MQVINTSPSWIDIIEENWDRLCIRQITEPAHRSAVLIPLVQNRDGETSILFEQRALDLDVQPAEICFPGGGIEEGETPLEAAVRETREELCLKRDQIRVIGEIEGVQNAGIVTIHAFLGELTGYAGTWSQNEVDHTFLIPVSWFLEHEPETYMTTITTEPGEDFPFDLIPGGRNYPWRRRQHPIYFYRHPEGVIWGLTAGMLQMLMQKLKDIKK